MAIFPLKCKMTTWQLCKCIFGFWADGDIYRAIGTRHVKFETADHNIPTDGTGCINTGNIFWAAKIKTMEICQAFMLHFIN
jgi:calcineurin-like phosphoesterase